MDLACKQGGGCIAIVRVGGGRRDLLHGSKKLWMTWNFGADFFYSEKMAGNLTCGPPTNIDYCFHQQQLLLPPLMTAIAAAIQLMVNGGGSLCQW
jgi:hypothetical protein